MSDKTELQLSELKEEVLEPNRDEIKEFVKWELRLAIEIHSELHSEMEDEEGIEFSEDEPVLIVGDVAKKVDDVVTDLAPDIGDIFSDEETETDENSEDISLPGPRDRIS